MTAFKKILKVDNYFKLKYLIKKFSRFIKWRLVIIIVNNLNDCLMEFIIKWCLNRPHH